MTTVKMVWAEDDQHAIGKNGQIPWHIPADLALFKRETMGSLMVMGRKTWASIGRPLPGRQTLVLTRQTDFDPGYTAVEVVHDLSAAIAKVKASQLPVSIVGGAQLYRDFMPMATDLVVTHVAGIYVGDTFVDPINLDQFMSVSQSPENQNGYHYTVTHYQRK